MAEPNNIVQPVRYTRDAAIKALRDKDKTVVLKGYILQIKPVITLNNGDRIFKIVFTNGNKKMHLMIWNENISKYEREMQVHRILHIEGAECTRSIFRNIRDKKMIDKDIIIQKWTRVSYLGFHEDDEYLFSQEPRNIEFENIPISHGFVKVKGYVSTTFSEAMSKAGSTYGSGAIASGNKKIPVAIKDYNETVDIESGLCVYISGILKEKDGLLSLYCRDIAGIEVDLEEEPMTMEQVENAYKLVKRPRQALSDTESDDD